MDVMVVAFVDGSDCYLHTQQLPPLHQDSLSWTIFIITTASILTGRFLAEYGDI